MIIKNYTELSKISGYKDRYLYLKENGRVGEETFGFERYLNQIFYKSDEWLSIRDHVIVRDNGCDLGIAGYELHGSIIVHHMNPIKNDDIRNRSKYLLDPEYLITTASLTHKAIHYGNEDLLILPLTERRAGDTCPWKHE